MLSRLRKFVDGLLRRRRFEDAMADEMRFHMEAYAADLAARGLPPGEAARRARIEFGPAESLKEDCRQSRGMRLVDEFRQDLRYALRQLARSPGFATAAIVSLALGIGANTAIFSLMDALLLRRLPVAEPERLVFLAHGRGTRISSSANFPLYERYKRADLVAGVAAYDSLTFAVRTADLLENVDGQYVTANYHAVIGAPFVAGHGFTAGDDRDSAKASVAVISDNYWARQFGRRPDAVGRVVSVNGLPVTIVGVTAPGFNGLMSGYRADVTLPMSARASQEPGYFDDRTGWVSLTLVGRLRAGQTETQARSAIDPVFRRFWLEPENAWIRRTPESEEEQAAVLSASRGSSDLRGQYTEPMWILLGMVSVVLFIASANVANLLLARAAARTKEVAVRLGIGAGRLRLVRQFLTESLLLAGLGGALGLLVAIVGIRAVLAVVSSGQWPVVLDATVNVRVLLFTVVIALITGIGFGLVPALRSTNVDVVSSLKTIAPGIGKARSPVGRALLVGQVAVSALVVVTAALLARSLYNLKSLDPGFAREHVLLFDVETRDRGFTNERKSRVYRELLERLLTMPGVTSAAMADRSPIDSSTQTRRLEIPGALQQPAGASSVAVTPAYFKTFGIALKRGRLLANLDRRGSQGAALVNETLARACFGEADPIGQTILLGGRKDRLTIVGVVADARHELLRADAPGTVYTPLEQPGEAFDGGDDLPMRLTAIIRTSGDPGALAGLVPGLAHDIDPDSVVAYVRTMEQQLDAALINERLLTRFSAAFGLLALLLASVGLHGVMAYRVARRKREIAIRMALGATRGRVLQDVLTEVAIIAVAGIAIGVFASFVTTKAIDSFLFGLSPNDPLTLGVVSAILVLTALAAGMVPGRRAAKTEPAIALRAE